MNRPSLRWLMVSLCLGLTGRAVAQEATSETYVMESSTMSMAGGASSSESYSETGSIGQPISHGAVAGGAYTIDPGYLNDLDADGDGIPGSRDECPMQFAGCHDQDGDGCIDAPDIDADFDGVTAGSCDCNDGNPLIWGAPGEVLAVRFLSPTLLTWDPPSTPGGLAPRFDVIRAGTAQGFTAGVCVESDDAGDLSATDTADPTIGAAFYYLVRAENACPGIGTLGISMGLFQRTAVGCP